MRPTAPKITWRAFSWEVTFSYGVFLRARLREFGQKSFPPPKICLLLHLCITAQHPGHFHSCWFHQPFSSWLARFCSSHSPRKERWSAHLLRCYESKSPLQRQLGNQCDIALLRAPSEKVEVFLQSRPIQGRNDGCKGGTIPRAPKHYGGAQSLRVAEWLQEAPKSHNNVTSTFFSTVHLSPKVLRFEHGDARLAPHPRRHLTPLNPWAYLAFFVWKYRRSLASFKELWAETCKHRMHCVRFRHWPELR